MKQYIRTNEDGERVVDYSLLDIAGRANLLRDVELWAQNIDLDLDDAEFSEAEKNEACNNAAADTITAMMIYDDDGAEVEIESDTKAMLVERLESALLAKYGLA